MSALMHSLNESLSEEAAVRDPLVTQVVNRDLTK